jgi:hypothetical protein
MENWLGFYEEAERIKKVEIISTPEKLPLAGRPLRDISVGTVPTIVLIDPAT